MEVAIELVRILINEQGESQVIVVQERDGTRRFPISIGLFEAAAIDRRLKGIPIPRPMTHELVLNVIEEMGGVLERIVISGLVNHTFIAKLIVRRDGQEIAIDCRPSDAIALAVGDETPLYCDEAVLEASALPPGVDM